MEGLKVVIDGEVYVKAASEWPRVFEAKNDGFAVHLSSTERVWVSNARGAEPRYAGIQCVQDEIRDGLVEITGTPEADKAISAALSFRAGEAKAETWPKWLISHDGSCVSRWDSEKRGVFWGRSDGKQTDQPLACSYSTDIARDFRDATEEESRSLIRSWSSTAQAEEPRVYRSMDDSVRVYDGKRSYGFRPNGTAYPEDHIVLTERGCQLGNHELLTGPERDEFVRAAKAGEDARWPKDVSRDLWPKVFACPRGHTVHFSESERVGIHEGGCEWRSSWKEVCSGGAHGCVQILDIQTRQKYIDIASKWKSDQARPTHSPQAELPSVEHMADEAVGSLGATMLLAKKACDDCWIFPIDESAKESLIESIRGCIAHALRLRDQQHGERGGR